VRARLADALAARASQSLPQAERVLAVHPALTGVAPRGLVRGTSMVCVGPAASSAAALVVAGPTGEGGWACVLGHPTLGVAAWGEAGVALERLVVVRSTAAVDEPSADEQRWGRALAAAIDGFDMVVVGPHVAARLGPAMARRVQARVQSRGGVLVLVGDPGAFAPDLRLHATARWHGLGAGHGHLRAREMRCALGGRRMPRGRRDTIWFPGPSGRIERFGADSSVSALAWTG
jgi:hypothetical protein